MKFLFLAALVFAPSIGFAQSPTETALKTAPSFFDWKIGAPLGTRYQTRYFSRTKSTTLVPEGSRKSRVDGTQIWRFTADFDVLPGAQNGRSRWKVTYRDFTMDTSSLVDGKPLPATVTGAMKTALAAYLKGLRGMNFIMELDERGDMTKVEGLDKARAQIVNSVQKIAPEMVPQVRAMVNQSLSEKTMRETFGKMGGSIPHYPVRVGESWTFQTAFPAELPFPVQIQAKRTLGALTSEIATLSDTGQMTVSKKGYKSPGAPAPVDLEFRGTHSANMRVERETGMTLEWNIAQRFGGTISAKEPGKNGKTISVPLWMKTESRSLIERR